MSSKRPHLIEKKRAAKCTAPCTNALSKTASKMKQGAIVMYAGPTGLLSFLVSLPWVAFQWTYTSLICPGTSIACKIV